jgi:hypothetical protein
LDAVGVPQPVPVDPRQLAQAVVEAVGDPYTYNELLSARREVAGTHTHAASINSLMEVISSRAVMLPPVDTELDRLASLPGELRRNVPVKASPSKEHEVDAIVLTSYRLDANIRMVAATARMLRKPVWVMVTSAADAAALRHMFGSMMPHGSRFIPVDLMNDSPFTVLECDRNNDLRADPGARNRSLKRNAALVIAHVCGFERLYFLDNDIVARSVEELAKQIDGSSSSVSADGPTYCANPYLRFADHSAIGYAAVAAGGVDDSYFGTGALAVYVPDALPWTASVYNEDWLACFYASIMGKFAVFGLVEQLPNFPEFARGRSVNEEFGEVLMMTAERKLLDALDQVEQSLVSSLDAYEFELGIADRLAALAQISEGLRQRMDARRSGGELDFTNARTAAIVDDAVKELDTLAPDVIARFFLDYPHACEAWKLQRNALPVVAKGDIDAALSSLGFTEVHVPVSQLESSSMTAMIPRFDERRADVLQWWLSSAEPSGAAVGKGMQVAMAIGSDLTDGVDAAMFRALLTEAQLVEKWMPRERDTVIASIKADERFGVSVSPSELARVMSMPLELTTPSPALTLKIVQLNSSARLLDLPPGRAAALSRAIEMTAVLVHVAETVEDICARAAVAGASDSNQAFDRIRALYLGQVESDGSFLPSLAMCSTVDAHVRVMARSHLQEAVGADVSDRDVVALCNLLSEDDRCVMNQLLQALVQPELGVARRYL